MKLSESKYRVVFEYDGGQRHGSLWVEDSPGVFAIVMREAAIHGAQACWCEVDEVRKVEP